MNAPSSVRPPPASGTRKKSKVKAASAAPARAALAPVAKAPAWQPIDTDFLTDQIASIIEAVQVQLALVSKACEAGPLSEAEARGVAVILTRLGDELDDNHIAESIERLANTGRPTMNCEIAAADVGADPGLVAALTALWRADKSGAADPPVAWWTRMLQAYANDWRTFESEVFFEIITEVSRAA